MRAHAHTLFDDKTICWRTFVDCHLARKDRLAKFCPKIGFLLSFTARLYYVLYYIVPKIHMRQINSYLVLC